MTAPERPAFYALGSGRAAELLTLLHPPYTLWHLSYYALGAALGRLPCVHRLLRKRRADPAAGRPDRARVPLDERRAAAAEHAGARAAPPDAVAQRNAHAQRWQLRSAVARGSARAARRSARR